jgi:hypothetical protein
VVIWSPVRRQEILRATAVRASDARAAVLAAYPGTHKQVCVRAFPAVFKCTTRSPGRKRIFLDVIIQPTGELIVQPD